MCAKQRGNTTARIAAVHIIEKKNAKKTTPRIYLFSILFYFYCVDNFMKARST